MEQVAKYKMTILQTAFSLSVDIYVRETKQRIGKVSRRKKPRRRDVTKKKVQRHTQRKIARKGEKKVEDDEVKKSKNSKEK